VSVGVWQMACRRVIKVVGRVVRDVWVTGACEFAHLTPALLEYHSPQIHILLRVQPQIKKTYDILLQHRHCSDTLKPVSEDFRGIGTRTSL
jgi:hypothetical protein